MKPDRFRVHVICDEPSHPTKRARVERFQLVIDHHKHPDRERERLGLARRDEYCLDPECEGCGSGGWRLVGGGHTSEHIDRDTDFPIPRKVMFGTRKTPSHGQLFDVTRERWPLECPLCGLRVELKRAAAERLAVGLANEGVSEVRLSDLAATFGK